jgi:hypothetical protein
MNELRTISNQERDLLAALLQLKSGTAHLVPTLAHLHVRSMNDGGMGSLLLIPDSVRAANRMFGRQLLLAECADSDGTPVSIALNLDSGGHLYELDLWKVDFGPLLRWPQPGDIKLIE